MARIFRFCILVLTILFIMVQGVSQVAAQESLRNLTKMERDQALDWRNSEFNFDLNIPPGASAATLTLFAEPGEVLPAPGTMMVVRVNEAAGVVVNPKPEAFSARIDVPSAHLKAGINRIRISFEGVNPGLCPIEADGGWHLDLARSRFDLSLSPDISSFAELEDWLAVGPWALSRVSIARGSLDHETYAALGALVTQGLAVRAGRVPQIVPASRIAGLDFSARINSGFARSGIALRPGARPMVEFQGRSQEDVLAMARLFAGRLIRLKSTRAAPALLANAPSVRGARALDGIKNALGERAWDARPFENTVRTPYDGVTRLVVDIERPDWVSSDSAVSISIDGNKSVTKRLKRSHNQFVVPLASKTDTVVRSFSISREAHPSAENVPCTRKSVQSPLKLLSARIESSGLDFAHGLARFAVDGAPFTNEKGKGTGIVFATSSDDQLYASWQAMARIALIAGMPLTTAWYGTEFDSAPHKTALIVLGPRSQLAPQLVASLPQVFAAGAAVGPKTDASRRKKPFIKVSRIAFADEASRPPGLGVAGWTEINQKPTLILTGEQGADFVPAMQTFADGQAVNQFAGEVVRWRAGLVEINEVGNKGAVPSSRHSIPAILFLIAGICLIGLWISLWRRVYANWEPV